MKVAFIILVLSFAAVYGWVSDNPKYKCAGRCGKRSDLEAVVSAFNTEGPRARSVDAEEPRDDLNKRDERQRRARCRPDPWGNVYYHCRDVVGR